MWLMLVHADAPREHENRHVMVTPFRVRICLGVPRTSQYRRCVCDVVPRWISIRVRSLRFILYLTLIRDRWTYTSILAYLVDANTGRSSMAVATNSSVRGLFAFVAAGIAVPLQVSQGYNNSLKARSEVL
jgi:hypothetical protein